MPGNHGLAGLATIRALQPGLAIIIVSGIFIGMVLALQGYNILVDFASEEAVGQMVALTLLAGCETMPKGMPSLPTLSRSTTVSPSAELPPPVVRAWPDAAQDVLNQRARGFGLVKMRQSFHQDEMKFIF